MEEFALSIGMKGLGYVKVREDMTFDGPIDKFLKEGDREKLIEINGSKAGDVIYFIADSKELAPKLAGQIRTEVANRLKLIDDSKFELCFITDFPMYELDENGKVIFTHNPFSMPQGGMQALLEKEPTDILAYQYDIVCNGVELSSGAVRNHDLDIMVKAFEIAGYSEEELKSKFKSLYNAFKYQSGAYVISRKLYVLRCFPAITAINTDRTISHANSCFDIIYRENHPCRKPRGYQIRYRISFSVTAQATLPQRLILFDRFLKLYQREAFIDPRFIYITYLVDINTFNHNIFPILLQRLYEAFNSINQIHIAFIFQNQPYWIIFRILSDSDSAQISRINPLDIFF